MSLNNWILAARPKTLTAAVVPVFAATGLVYAHEGPLILWIVLACLGCSLLIQIATNFINDIEDFKRGADDQNRLGPIRATQAGLLTERQLWWAAILCMVGALALGLPLVQHGGWPILLIGVSSLFLGYAYTGGPFPLAYWGLGELFVVLFFGIVPVSGIYFLLEGEWDQSAAVLGLQVGLHCAILIAINNLRDVMNDQKAGRRTGPVLFGVQYGKAVICLLIWLPYLLGLYWFQTLLDLCGILPYLSLPLAASLTRNIIATPPSATYNKFLGQAALLHLSFGFLTAVGMYICRP